MSSADPSLAQRYGAPSRLRRGLVIGLAALIIMPGVAWLAWATLSHANPAVASQVVAHEIVDDHTATVTALIEYDDGPVPATCTARAIAHDKAVVGEVNVQPDPDDGRQQTFTIATDRRATTVDWIGCTTEGQPRPR